MIKKIKNWNQVLVIKVLQIRYHRRSLCVVETQSPARCRPNTTTVLIPTRYYFKLNTTLGTQTHLNTQFQNLDINYLVLN